MFKVKLILMATCAVVGFCGFKYMENSARLSDLLYYSADDRTIEDQKVIAQGQHETLVKLAKQHGKFTCADIKESLPLWDRADRAYPLVKPARHAAPKNINELYAQIEKQGKR